MNDLCRREGIKPHSYYSWTKEFMEAGKERLTRDSVRDATRQEIQALKRENGELKQLVAELSLEAYRLKKRSSLCLRTASVNGGEIMYRQGGSRAEMWRLKSVPPVAFNQERPNLTEGGLDVQGGYLPPCSQGLFRRRDERPRGGPVRVLGAHYRALVGMLGSGCCASTRSERKKTKGHGT